MIKKKTYKNYSKLSKKAIEYGVPQIKMPHLLVMQIGSFENFLQSKIFPKKRTYSGLQRVFKDIFPIEDAKGIYKLDFNEYKVLKEKYSEMECVERNLTFEAPIKAKLSLTIYDAEVLRRLGERKVQNIIEQEVYLGEIPLITSKGTFIINGSEHVIISQLKRSPGVFFSSKDHKTGKKTYNAKIVPYIGSWLQLNLGVKDTLYLNIDKRKKIPFTIYLRVLGLETNSEIRETFLEGETLKIDETIDRFLFDDIFDPENGELAAEAGAVLTEELIADLKSIEINEVKVVKEEFETQRKVIENSIKKDPTTNYEEAVKKIYTVVRPGEEPTVEIAQDLFDRMFRNEKRYSLKEIGRYKLNNSLDLDINSDEFFVTKEDYIAIVQKMFNIISNKDQVDDIDNLSNRRIRTISELLGEQYDIGLRRVVRIAVERMAVAKPEDVTIHDLINSNALDGVVKSFFLTGQLSQYMEQTNPLAALTHKRRFSAVGPGGLTRERAGLDVRDVHYTHYGRICPIETPEGPNIGLITSPALYSRVNKLGFIETPYIKIVDGKITDEIEYLDANKEEKYTIAPANVAYNENKEITEKLVFARRRGEYIQAAPEEVGYMDVTSNQIISVSAALVPFIENDAANRALMGANMQRQAVPLLINDNPVVGTGVEKVVGEESGLVEKSPFDGTITNVTSEYIDIEKDESAKKIDLVNDSRIYLKKFLKTNQDTVFNQNPIVKVGDVVKKGDIITDGPNIADGRLALGKNLLVAFMSWYGYNYEDAIIINEKLARDDVLTSVHIKEKEVMVRTVKNGKEELAYDIPNVPVKALRNLDKTGIIRVGSVINPGDIIVGKITPKNIEVEPSAEENLMRALFGDRAGDFTNTSLKAKNGMSGVVIDVKVFSRRDKSYTDDEEIKQNISVLKDEQTYRDKKIFKFLEMKISELLIGCVAKNILDSKNHKYFIPTGKKITKADLKKINFERLDLNYEMVESEEINQQIFDNVVLKVKNAQQESKNIYKKEVDRCKHGDELPNGVLKMVKVYIANKRKIKVGDKVAGRHGNKGIISKVAPDEDMPFLEDGTSVDVILNTLGVPSRMNIGQIMEAHLGMAAQVLGFNAETPSFDGATVDDIIQELKNADLPADGKQKVYDGKTGDPFKERVTIGVMYIIKLHHLADEKMHARSTGPYSLITQQPLGGKAQQGGQRLGEMEVWALEAYGAANLLEEMLTIKSDDVDGRTKTFKALTKGENPPEYGIPESFNVLVSELKSLGFDIEFVNDDDDENSEFEEDDIFGDVFAD